MPRIGGTIRQIRSFYYLHMNMNHSTMTTDNNNTNQNNNTGTQSLFGIRGQVLTYKDNPLFVPAADCYDYYPDGLWWCATA